MDIELHIRVHRRIKGIVELCQPVDVVAHFGQVYLSQALESAVLPVDLYPAVDGIVKVIEGSVAIYY